MHSGGLTKKERMKRLRNSRPESGGQRSRSQRTGPEWADRETPTKMVTEMAGSGRTTVEECPEWPTQPDSRPERTERRRMARTMPNRRGRRQRWSEWLKYNRSRSGRSSLEWPGSGQRATGTTTKYRLDKHQRTGRIRQTRRMA